ncbi:hypothetical protein BU16DRAFT_482847 [Lophium mytilinum]|uniref:Uncharacterized protein n=1 Tax=Lophium mytilinum TaxID=390894 RepID=A0A6A6QZL0_9PEZI|nr:hypothetical protein BU16DRAFT_482847 [Lophium mytilinum]
MQEQIKNIFKTALRPVVASRRDERRRLEAEQVVGAMIRKLEQRLPKMPFPPNTKDTDFDLEKVVERNRMLENQLTPAMHSIDLLKAAIEKEEAQLERDKEVLAEFEENAKAEKTALKNMSVKPHPMLRLPKNFEIGDDSAEDIGLVRQKTAKQALFDDPDPDFAPLLDTLRNHLESMQGNHEQVQGIDAVMQEAQAALDDVLFTHASPQQYDSMSRP